MEIGGIEITKREILFSTLIIAFMLCIGVLISDSISQSASEKYITIVTSTRVNDSTNFDYIRRTNVGNFLAEGTLIADNPVSIPDISGSYARIKRIYEEYREHERIVTETYTDSKGNVKTRTKTETYWSWDEISHSEWSVNTFEFLGKHFTPSSIHYHLYLSYHSTKDIGYHKRYVYETSPMTVYGTIVGKTENKSYTDMYFRESTIDKIIKSAEFDMNHSSTIFWVFWIILTNCVVIGFYAIENKWLED